MRTVLAGASGLIGAHLTRGLAEAGHEIAHLVRHAGATAPPGVTTCPWDPTTGEIEAQPLESSNLLIHLAGEPIAAGRWTPERKRCIAESRIQGTRLLARTLAGLSRPPQLWISASAVGWYGNRPPEEPVDEQSAPGTGYLAEICGAWEAATRAAEDSGIRVIHLRIGVVLDPSGGALARMLPIFRWGLGGRLGTGRQPMSWIALEEFTPLVRHLIAVESLRGPVNATAPQPICNAEFTRALAATLRRPAWARAPAFVLRALLGEMGDALLLEGASVRPTRLLESGYRFRRPELGPALAAMLSGT